MSGIVGSRLNIRGSGLVGSLGTDGQIFTSSGAGTGAVFEDAAGGGAILQVQTLEVEDTHSNSASAPAAITAFNIAFTPTSSSSKLCLQLSMSCSCNNERLAGYFYDSTGSAIIGPIADAASNRARYTFGSPELGPHVCSIVNCTVWFTPGDTTARTIQVFAAAQATTTLYINRTYTDTDDATLNNSRSGASTFTITEYDGDTVTIS